MHVKRIKSAALITCAVMAVFFPLATSAQAAISGATASQRPAITSASCAFATANLGFEYFEPMANHSLAWSSEGSAQGNPVMLGNLKSSSPLDCFKKKGGFPGGALALQQYNTPGLCLNVAGNSHSAGAWIILYSCTYPANELFYPVATQYGVQFKSESSGLCIDLRSGLSVYSILQQEPCDGLGNDNQEWYMTS